MVPTVSSFELLSHVRSKKAMLISSSATGLIRSVSYLA